MTDDLLVGPVEVAVLEFPDRRFDGEILPALAELVDDRIVSILDLALITRDVDGTFATLEITDLDDHDAFDDLDGEVNGLLSDADLERAGASLSLGSSALVVVWEDSWARRLVDAVAASGGRVVAHDRLDAETVNAALTDVRAADR